VTFPPFFKLNEAKLWTFFPPRELQPLVLTAMWHLMWPTEKASLKLHLAYMWEAWTSLGHVHYKVPAPAGSLKATDTTIKFNPRFSVCEVRR